MLSTILPNPRYHNHFSFPIKMPGSFLFQFENILLTLNYMIGKQSTCFGNDIAYAPCIVDTFHCTTVLHQARDCHVTSSTRRPGENQLASHYNFLASIHARPIKS